MPPLVDPVLFIVPLKTHRYTKCITCPVAGRATAPLLSFPPSGKAAAHPAPSSVSAATSSPMRHRCATSEERLAATRFSRDCDEAAGLNGDRSL